MMTRPFRSLFILFALALCGAGVRQARADGMAFPVVAVRKFPEIPQQRALLVWRGGQEQLIVESTFKGEGDRFGWIIPLPARPTRFEAVAAGILEDIAQKSRPDIIAHNDWVDLLYYIAIIVLIWTLIAYYHGGVRYQILLPGLVLSFILGAYLLVWLDENSSLFFDNAWRHQGTYHSKAGGGDGDYDKFGIRNEKSERVGNYQVEVLQARTPQALNAWLERSGFSTLPPQGEKIVSNLIGENWHFVVAKLISDGSGPFKPHPMSIAFPSQKLIYPMRLTALAGSQVYLELYTVAEREAANPALTTEYCDTFQGTQVPYFFAARHNNPVLTQPEVSGQMWDGCTLTRLATIMKPEEMTRDITFDWVSPHPFRKTYYSAKGAYETVMVWSLAAWCVAVLEILLLVGLMRGPALRALLPVCLNRLFRKRRLASHTGAALCGAVIFTGLFRQSVPTALLGYGLALAPLLFIAARWKATRPRRRRFLGWVLLLVTLAVILFGVTQYFSLPITPVDFEFLRY